MENRKTAARRSRLALKAAAVFALTAAVFLFLYQYDNKYTAEGPEAKDGVLELDGVLSAKDPVFLVDGWEYYGGRLLTPEDFAADPPVPDQYMFIGQFGGFEKWNGGSPHGSASYRLNIRVSERPGVYMLELPEIFSAYRLYINGRQAAQMGNPDPESYRPQTGNRSVIVEAGGNIELLFAVSDYSNLYSGMVYPPAFGSPESVSRLLNARIILRSLLCAAVLAVGLLSVLAGLLARRDALALLFGLLCVFFVGYAEYPLTRTLFACIPAQYAVERISFCLMLLIVMLIVARMSGLPRKWSLPFIGSGALMCAASAGLHLLIPFGSLGIMLAYERLVLIYEWLAAGFVAVAVLYVTGKGSARITPMFYGAVTFACALIMDRLLPGYEPILTGWFVELASFTLVLWIGAAAGQDMANRYRESFILTERANSMERLYQSQLSHYETLRREIDAAKTLRHDMRHHLTLLNEYAQSGQYDRLTEYIKGYREASADRELPEYCPIDVINVLTHHYHEAARNNGIRLEIRCDLKMSAEPGRTGMSSADLCCLYANLMENAVEACIRASSDKRNIRIAVFRIAPDTLNIHVWNTSEGIRRTGGRFLSLKQNGMSGYGLSSVKTIAEKYGGSAEFRWREESMEFESKISIPII